LPILPRRLKRASISSTFAPSLKGTNACAWSCATWCADTHRVWCSSDSKPTRQVSKSSRPYRKGTRAKHWGLIVMRQTTQGLSTG
jgi:hypothetical protein